MSCQYQAGRLHEMPGMEKPLPINFPPMGRYGKEFQDAAKVYNDHLASLKSYPVTPGNWQEGKVYEEGKIEMVKEIGNVACFKPFQLKWSKAEPEDEWENLLPEYRRIIARLIQKESEDEQGEMWEEVRAIFMTCGFDPMPAGLKRIFKLIKR